MPTDLALIKIGNSPNFYIQWFEGGHSRRHSTRTPDRKQANAVLAAFRLEVARQPSGGVTLAEVLDWYIANRGGELVRLDSAELGVKHLKEFFGSTLADDVRLDTQDRYRAHRRAKGVTDETVRRELSVLSAAMVRAAKHDKIAAAPPILSIAKAPARDRWLTRQEAAKLLRQIRRDGRGNHLLLFTRLALWTGQRTGVILSLTWDRVDFDRARIAFPVPGRKVTNKRSTTVPIEPHMVRMLRAAKRKADKRGSGPFVIQWKGQPVERVARGFRRHAKAAGLSDVSPHTLRHTFATWAALAGEPLFLIGKTMGQSVVSMTEKYAKHQPEALRSVAKAVRRK